MNDEIKEMLDRAKNLKYKCDCCEEIAPGKYIMRNDKQTDNLIEAVYIIDKLLDYITNLQQDNEMYAQLKDEYEEEIKDLQQENYELNRMCELYGKSLYYAELKDYKSRCEKAIEELKQAYTDIRNNDNANYIHIAFRDDLLNILQGENNDK